MFAALGISCSTVSSVRVLPPDDGMCFDFEDYVEGALPVGFIEEKPPSASAKAALRIAPARGIDGGRAIQIRAVESMASTLWLLGARFSDTRISVALRPLESGSRLGLVLAPDVTPSRSSPLPTARVDVLWDVAAGALVVHESAGRGTRELARIDLAPAPGEWRRLVIERRGGELALSVDGVELTQLRLLDESAKVGVGIAVQGAGVFDDLWIS